MNNYLLLEGLENFAERNGWLLLRETNEDEFNATRVYLTPIGLELKWHIGKANGGVFYEGSSHPSFFGHL